MAVSTCTGGPRICSFCRVISDGPSRDEWEDHKWYRRDQIHLVVEMWNCLAIPKSAVMNYINGLYEAPRPVRPCIVTTRISCLTLSSSRSLKSYWISFVRILSTRRTTTSAGYKKKRILSGMTTATGWKDYTAISPRTCLVMVEFYI